MPAGIHQVVIKGTVFGQAYQVTRYWDAALTDPNYQDFVDRLGSAFKGAIEIVTHDEVRFTSIYVRPVALGSIGIDLIPDEFPAIGTLDSAIGFPSIMAVQIEYTGATLTYPYKGYNRMAGLTEDQVTEGTIDPIDAGSWRSVGVTLSQAYGLVNLFSPVLYSYTYGTSQPIVDVSVDLQVATQKTRKPGRGA